MKKWQSLYYIHHIDKLEKNIIYLRYYVYFLEKTGMSGEWRELIVLMNK